MSAQAEKDIWLPKETNALLNELLTSRTEIKTSEPGSDVLLRANLRLAMRNVVSITLRFLPEKTVLEALRPLSIRVAIFEKLTRGNLGPAAGDVFGAYDSSQCRIHVYDCYDMNGTAGHELDHRIKHVQAPEPYEGASSAYTEGIAGLHGAVCSADALSTDMIGRGICLLKKLSGYPSHGASTRSFFAEFDDLRFMSRSYVEERLRSILRGDGSHKHKFYEHERGYKFAALSLLAHGLEAEAALRDMVGTKSEEAVPKLAERLKRGKNEFVFEELHRRRFSPDVNQALL